VQEEGRKEQHDISQYKRFVTFYFTNFPPQLSNFYLHKGFEVCGILEEVVIPSRRNVNGEMYVFVRFSKVRDVGKLLKAMNAVCFGNFCVREKLARFDRSVEVVGNSEMEGEGLGGAVSKKEGEEGGKKVYEGTRGGGKKQVGEGEIFLTVLEKWIGNGNGKGSMEVGKEVVEEGVVEVVRVGDVVVTVRDGKGKGGRGRGVSNDVGKAVKGVMETGEDGKQVVEKQQPVSKKMV